MPPILGIWASSISKAAPDTGSMFPIGEFTLASAQTTITFNNIPQTYTHLQIRGIARNSTTSGDWVNIKLNGNTSTRYHVTFGDGASASSDSAASAGLLGINVVKSNELADTFGPIIIDILDYKNTNKNKTVRALGGKDINGSGGYVALSSALLTNTSAITSISLEPNAGSFATNSAFQLYGVLA
jgi:hypothetical protein